MLHKCTTPWFIDVSFKKSVEYQLQVTPRTKCGPPFFTESQSDQWHNVIVFHKAHGSYLWWELNAGTTSAVSCTLSKPGVNEWNLYLNIIYDRKNYITNYLVWVDSCGSFVITLLTSWRNNPIAASHFIYSQFIVHTSVQKPAPCVISHFNVFIRLQN